MSTTTIAAIRDRVITVIRQLTPSVHASDPFLPFANEDRALFELAAASNPDGSVRLFQVRQVGDDETPEWSDATTEERFVRLRISVAYPQSNRWGPDLALDRDDAIASDRDQIERAVGMYGKANFTPPHAAACWRPQPKPLRTTLRSEACDFLVIEQTMAYFHDASLTSPTASTLATSDATSGKLVPATALEWDTLLGSIGIASGGPRTILLMQDTATPLVDVNGISTIAEVVAGAGHYLYRQPVTNWSRLAIGTTTGAVDIGFVQQHGNLPSPDTNSYLMLAYVQITSTPTTNQGLMSCTDSALYVGVKASTLVPIIGSASGQASSGVQPLPVGSVFPLVLKVDNTNKVIKAYTPYEIINEAWSAPGANTGEVDFGVALASGIYAASALYLYGAIFTGGAAEMRDDQIGSLLSAMGWPITWHDAPVKDATRGVYCPTVASQWRSIDIAPPSFVWPLQEGSGIVYNDVAGDCPLIRQAIITAGAAVPGMSRVGLQLTDGGKPEYANSTDTRLPDTRTQSSAILAYVDVTAAAFGSGGSAWSWLVGFDTDQECFAIVKPTGEFGIYQNNVMTFGTANQLGSVRPVLLVYDRLNARCVLYTDVEKIVASNFATPGTHGGISIGIGGGFVFCPGGYVAFMASWVGHAAEMTDAQARAQLQKLGWALDW